MMRVLEIKKGKIMGIGEWPSQAEVPKTSQGLGKEKTGENQENLNISDSIIEKANQSEELMKRRGEIEELEEGIKKIRETRKKKEIIREELGDKRKIRELLKKHREEGHGKKEAREIIVEAIIDKKVRKLESSKESYQDIYYKKLREAQLEDGCEPRELSSEEVNEIVSKLIKISEMTNKEDLYMGEFIVNKEMRTSEMVLDEKSLQSVIEKYPDKQRFENLSRLINWSVENFVSREKNKGKKEEDIAPYKLKVDKKDVEGAGNVGYLNPNKCELTIKAGEEDKYYEDDKGFRTYYESCGIRSFGAGKKGSKIILEGGIGRYDKTRLNFGQEDIIIKGDVEDSDWLKYGSVSAANIHIEGDFDPRPSGGTAWYDSPINTRSTGTVEVKGKTIWNKEIREREEAKENGQWDLRQKTRTALESVGAGNIDLTGAEQHGIIKVGSKGVKYKGKYIEFK